MRSRDRKYFEAYGEVFFITSTVVGFINVFDYQPFCDVFVDCLRFCQKRGDFVLLAYVLMPNHFHLLLRIGKNKNISGVVGSIKRYTARKIGQLLRAHGLMGILDQIRSAALSEPGKGTAIWKPRFDSFVITSEETLRQKIEYIHNNPVRKGLIRESTRWRHSSAAAYAGKSGIDLPVDSDWCCLGYR